MFCGVDVGASATKLVLLDETGEVRARVVRPSGVDYEATAEACLAEALAEASDASVRSTPSNRDEPISTVSTGYGRRNVPFADAARTEINCHAVGAFHFFPRPICVVDIGGQDNKVIHVMEDGRAAEFHMNRKCAAGTGAFIEEIALRLDLDVSEMDALAAKTTEAVKLGSFCTVFTKTEILAHLRRGVPVEQIVRGAFLSVIQRIIEMDPLEGEVVLTGGVAAHNPTIAVILSERLGRPVDVPPYPQFTGALGAALTAAKNESEK